MVHPRTGFAFGENPLTDPRSVAVSTVLHLGFIIVAALTVLHGASPASLDLGTKVLQGELGPIDNRAEPIESSSGAGGGSPGEIGGMGSLEFAPSGDANDAGGASRDPADALLSEILPAASQPAPNNVQPSGVAGTLSSGMGAIPASGVGGGGGSGGGSGGGIGRSIGPGTQFFGARDHANSFAYVIDCSGSMATRNSLAVAKRELLNSLNQLPADAEFCVVFYNLIPRVLSDPQGRKGLMAATTANKTRVQNQLQTVVPDGGTDHMKALRSALSLKPEVVFFLTDADLMTNGDVNEILTEVGSTRIQAIEFGRGSDLGDRTPLRRLATTTGGTYLYIDVSQFPKTNG